LIGQTQVNSELAGFVNPENSSNQADYLGNIDQIEDIVRINQVDELVFCAASISSRQIINTMLQFTDSGIEFKIAPPESLSVIGSNSSTAAGDLYTLHFNTLSRLLNRRKKRLFDIAVSLILLAFSPVLAFFTSSPAGLFRNLIQVLFGFSSWVGYYQTTGELQTSLPKIKQGILTPYDLKKGVVLEGKTVEQVNLTYAKDYRIFHDLQIIISGFTYLGRKPDTPSNIVPGSDPATHDQV
jgi:hypothetical protein